jgi:hypothetical protein
MLYDNDSLWSVIHKLCHQSLTRLKCLGGLGGRGTLSQCPKSSVIRLEYFVSAEILLSPLTLQTRSMPLTESCWT